jgi:hypothetical protein
MTRYLLIFVIILSGIRNMNAQSNLFDEFGKINQTQLSMKECSYDPSADAVVLFDAGKSWFSRTDNGFDVMYQRITRIKIFNEAGKKYAAVAIPFYQEGDIYEKVVIDKASTYTITDDKLSRMTPLDPASCYVEKMNENWKVKKFVMPDVQPGSIIEYTYTVRSQYHFNLRDWEFQWDIPVLYSEYNVRMIPFYEYQYVLQGRKSIDNFQSFEDKSGFEREYFGTKFYDMVYVFGLKNIPAYVNEEFSPSREDNIVKIDFQMACINRTDGVKIKIMTTWPELVTEYLKNENFGKYLKKSENSADKVISPDSLVGKTAWQKASWIIDYLKDNYSWNHINSRFANQSVSEFLKTKSGNSADINLWLTGALRAAGLEAYPMVLSTRSNGKIKTDYPFSDAFNFVICAVMIDGNMILVDATDSHCPDTRIPTECLNDRGLLIDKDKLQWCDLQVCPISHQSTSIRIDSIGNTMHGLVVRSATEYEAVHDRGQYGDRTLDLLKDLSTPSFPVDEASLKIKNATDRDRPYSFSYQTNCRTEMINGKIYIRPFLNEIYSENPLKQKSRTYPIDLTYPVQRQYQSWISIPDGYKVDFLPEPAKFSDENFEFEYSVIPTENSININLTYAFKKAVYPSDQYAQVKNMLERIVRKGAENVVLIKK